MRLLIAADIFPPESGGPATYAVTLANELAKQGIEVAIVSLNSQSSASAVSCPLYCVAGKNKLLKYAQYFYLLWRKAKQADVVYAMGPVNAGLPAWLAARWRGKKFVVKVVGDYAWEQWQNQKADFISIEEFQSMKSRGKIGWLKKIERLVCQRADQIIVPSQYLKKIVASWGVSNKKVEVIYNAVEFKSVEPIQKPAAEKWIVSVGRLVKWKGMVTLVEIIPDILKEIPEARLKIIGEGPELESLKSKVISLELENYVELLGNLSHEKTLAYIHAADVFVLNSGYEGMSHVILEALSFGKPVLASNVGGNPEIIVPEKTGYLFAYNNSKEIQEKIINYLNGKFRFSEAETIRVLVNKSLEYMMDNTVTTLKKLINPSAPVKHHNN